MCYHFLKGVALMIIIRLSALRGVKRWNQKKLARITGIRETTISELDRQIALRISFEHMNLICEAFQCQPGDIFIYVPDDPLNLRYAIDGEPIGRTDNP